MGLLTTTSFFPAKPLGGFGDGGAILTDDDGLAEAMRSIRLHGRGKEKYDVERIGVNSRLDTIQAAILLEKLKIFPDEIERRQQIAERYDAELRECVVTPFVPQGVRSVWAQYTLKIAGGRRDEVAEFLKGRGIATAVYYPRGVHQQMAFRDYRTSKGGAPVAQRLAGEVLSIPMHPYLEDAQQDRIVDAVRRAVAFGAGPA
jgi:dTDP-4-amino-4,6-dideoxygalactose transaminase